MSGRCYTLDVNPTSASRVKVRLYESRPIRSGGNILLLQGQLSVGQFGLLEALLLMGAERDGIEVLRVGRHYAPGRAVTSAAERGATATRAKFARSAPVASGASRGSSSVARGAGAESFGPRKNECPRAPWLTGPVIGPDGPVDDDGAGDDYDALAHLHVQRMLRRLRAEA
ncbi:MAG TPA: hypothetical protein VFK39_04595 [Gemmatimonadaceae bacterium]|nr:hypothetical protein [Gemmatimonadaceae bacterium]